MRYCFAGRRRNPGHVHRMQRTLLLAMFCSCVSAHAVPARPPLTLTCTAPASVAEGGSANIACSGTSELHRPLTYSFATTAGTIAAHGSSAVFISRKSITGSVTIVATVRDDMGNTLTQRLPVLIQSMDEPKDIRPGAVVLGHRTAPAPHEHHDVVLHDVVAPPPPPAVSEAQTALPPVPAAVLPGPTAGASASDGDRAVVKWVNGLPFGHITDNISSYSAMRLGVPYTVTVTIGGSDMNLAAPAGGPAPAALKVSDHMDVELASGGNPDDFAIVPVDPAQNPRMIVSNALTTWSWTVTPKALGELKLDVAAYVLYGDQQQDRVSYETYNRSIDVKSVTLWGYVTDGVEYVLENPGASLKYMLPGGGGATIIALLYAWWKKRKTSNVAKRENKAEAKTE